MRLSMMILSSLSVLTGHAAADVLTGDWPTDGFAASIPEVGFETEVNGATGGGFSNGYIDFNPDPGLTGAFLLDNEFGNHFDHNSFDLGESLSAHADTANSITFVTNDNKFGDVVNAMGPLGETQFLGFQINESDGLHYGFIQFTRVGEAEWELIGWAYEDQANVDLVTFDLVPAPSGVALLALGGLAATRRRR